ncbi:hypothetical protein Hamer_G009460 [Homarus americanus]|uniref:Uncharacterized protein n=1 Tax=Homarus americanus TaxID=6706 RepID=A0A8J5J5I3_HOMAM|nr:hypothetical protein Hamer_G009460 [Homarus americanus]
MSICLQTPLSYYYLRQREHPHNHLQRHHKIYCIDSRAKHSFVNDILIIGL